MKILYFDGISVCVSQPVSRPLWGIRTLSSYSRKSANSPAPIRVIEPGSGLHLLAGDGVRVPNYPRTILAELAPNAQMEYALRFDADEDYVHELIDRINEIAVRGVQLCRRCAEKYPGSWQTKSESAQCAECGRGVKRYFMMTKSGTRLL